MRLFLIAALLWNLSPIPQAAAETISTGNRPAPRKVIAAVSQASALISIRQGAQGSSPKQPSVAGVAASPAVSNLSAPPAQAPNSGSEAISPAAVQLESAGARIAKPSGAPAPANSELGQRQRLNTAFDHEGERKGDSSNPPLIGDGKVSGPGGSGLSPNGGGNRGSDDGRSVPPASPDPAPEGGYRRLFNWANLLTAGNYVNGLAAIIWAASHSVKGVALFLGLAMVCDKLDGWVARKLKIESDIGLNLDSQADGVSFGTAGALLLYWNVWEHSLAGFALSAAFGVAGILRLARFNVDGKKPVPAGQEKPDSFTGMPIPMGAGVALAVVAALPLIPAAWALPVAASVTALAAAAMVSEVPYPAFKKGGIRALMLPASWSVSSAALLWVLGQPWLIPAALFGPYLLFGPIYQSGDERYKKEVERKGFHQLHLLYLAGFLLAGYPLASYLMAGWMPIVLGGELLRLKTSWGKAKLGWLFAPIIREEKEANTFSAIFYGCVGIAFTIALFGWNPALVTAVLLALTWGDAASPLVGMRLRIVPYEIKGTKRSLDGTLAGFAAALLIGLGTGFPLLNALIAATAFSVVDTYPVKPDDNLWIPIVVATALYSWPLLSVVALAYWLCHRLRSAAGPAN